MKQRKAAFKELQSTFSRARLRPPCGPSSGAPVQPGEGGKDGQTGGPA